MRPLSALTSLLLAAFISAPAAAQFVGRHVYEPVGTPDPFIGDSRQQSPGVCRDLRNLRHAIRQQRESGALSGREARQLRREARAIERLAARYADDGLTASEQAELETRTHVLSDTIKRQR